MIGERKLRYLPIFFQDAQEIVSYISDTLQNPAAARSLIDDIEQAILERLPNAENYASYPSEKTRENPYYTIKVRNFLVFYVVLHDGSDTVMEVRRILYKKRNISKLLF